MKQFLDRFDQSSIWVRIFILALLMLVLMMGLAVARSMQRGQQSQTRITAPSSSSSSSSSSSKSPEEEAFEEAEDLVKKVEEEQNEGNLRAAKEKVDALPDGDRKNDLNNRLQAVATALGLDLQTLSSSSSSQEAAPAPSSAAPVAPAAPAASQVTTYVEQPQPAYSVPTYETPQPVVPATESTVTGESTVIE
ncbi:hypothetical protein JEQ21_04430 [Streptococcus sp. 121]|uniref:hypothetical protein n=1 Tax=Streptococcus sp. 121 TaxID=2797637 RepID=UPI0018F0FF3C|nr:hypothetical protein [Streptococcus sp. 121]MBJ6745718.1 hypothetical protein [Streptococcus sp. 121]